MEEYKQNGEVQLIIFGIRKEWNDPRFRENYLQEKEVNGQKVTPLKLGIRENRTDLKSYNKQRLELMAIAVVKIVRLYLS